MNTFPVILDTDPGLDDAVAIGMLSAFCGENIISVISSYGNVNIDITTKNVLDLLKLYNVNAPVLRGCSHPLGHKTYEDAPHIHGINGLGGLELTPSDNLPLCADCDTSIKTLYDTIVKHKKVDYITLGPMTNLATLITTYPDVVTYIGKVVTMGGGFSMGNVTPYAEFNIYCDPHASNICFESALDISLVPLNTTHQVALSLEDIEQICVKKGNVSDIIKQILTANFYSNVADGDEGSIVHDATAVMYYLFPGIFSPVAHLDITTRIGGEEIGQTLEIGNRPNVFITTNISKKLAMDKLTQMVIHYAERTH